MIDFSDFKNDEFDDELFLSKKVRKLLSICDLTAIVINEESAELDDANNLIEDCFPIDEAEDYKPSNLISDENTFCFALLKSGIVIACITAKFDCDDGIAEILSFCVDKEYRNKKIGSLLLLSFEEIASKFEITYVSLISSEYAKIFYKSFGFHEKAHNSFEIELPFDNEIAKDKFKSIHHCIKDTHNRKKSELDTFGIFSKETNKQENDKSKNDLAVIQP